MNLRKKRKQEVAAIRGQEALRDAAARRQAELKKAEKKGRTLAFLEAGKRISALAKQHMGGDAAWDMLSLAADLMELGGVKDPPRP